MESAFWMCLVFGSLINSVLTDQHHHGSSYPQEYLEDNCQPFYDDDNGTDWFLSVLNLTEPHRKLYGYVEVTRKNAYDNPLNCAIKILAPVGYKLVIRVPRIEINHDQTDCDFDFMSIIGATDSLHYCGFGTVAHSIGSTANWLIARIKTTDWDVNHSYMGFRLYYTAIHEGPCDDSDAHNSTEWQCRTGYCIPGELTCDDRDNCGNWDDERVRVCGLSRGAIIAITIVCLLIGGTALFFVSYTIYSRQKEKRIRRQRRQEVTPTVSLGYTNGGRNLTVLPSVGGVDASGVANRHAEPPPPYTPVAYINLGLYTGEGDQQQPSGDNTATTQAPAANGNLNVRLTNAANLRPTMGVPPPLYTASSGATGGGAEANSGVSFDPLPEKTDD